MTYFEVTRRFTFSSGHRLSKHLGKCKQLHGHNYTCEVTLRSKKLNQQGMVVDFGFIKQIFKKKVEEKFDHRLILKKGDSYNERLKESMAPNDSSICWVNYSPTAENMAQDILSIFQHELADFRRLKVVRVRLYETEDSFAEVFVE